MAAPDLTLAKRFLAAYNTLDQYLRKGRNDPRLSYSALIEDSTKIPASQKSRLRVYGHLRNAITHSERGIDEPIAEPHVEEVEKFERIVKGILDPPTALSKGIPSDRIFSVSYSDNVFHVIKQMNSSVYTHAPVLQEGSVIGVFSENVVFSYLGHHSDALLDSTATIELFRDFLPLEAHTSETFRFVSRGSSLVGVAQMFVKALDHRDRLGAVFITESGNQSQALLGMLTAWDLAGSDLAWWQR